MLCKRESELGNGGDLNLWTRNEIWSTMCVELVFLISLELDNAVWIYWTGLSTGLFHQISHDAFKFISIAFATFETINFMQVIIIQFNLSCNKCFMLAWVDVSAVQPQFLNYVLSKQLSDFDIWHILVQQQVY